MTRKNSIRPAERYSMTIEEAAEYSLIGDKRLRKIIDDNPYLDWILRVGSWTRIKRVQFEKWLDQVNDL